MKTYTAWHLFDLFIILFAPVCYLLSFNISTYTGAHFDNSFECSVPYLTDICPFEVHGHYFLAVSVCEPHNDIYPDQSYIMRYNLHTEAFLIDQYIYTHGAKDWEFFVISEDKDQENFLVLASNEKDGNYDPYLNLVPLASSL